MDILSGTATFVMPYYTTNSELSKIFIEKSIRSVLDQTDNNWKLVIIDDSSPDKNALAHLDELKSKFSNKIHVIKKTKHSGPGESRNMGIKWAYVNKSPIILFLDADDLAHCKRLEVVRRIMAKDHLASVVYSSFKVIDEYDNDVGFEKLSGTLQKILEGHKNPVEGFNAWIDIGTNKGYTNLTSSTNVRTEIALKYPFPNELVSEDSFTWLRYSAGGGKFVFNDEITSSYRVKTVQSDIVTSTVSVLGKEKFCETLCRVDSRGFLEAVEISISNGKIRPENKDELIIKSYLRLAQLMDRENCLMLANKQIKEAKKINLKLFNDLVQSFDK